MKNTTSIIPECQSYVKEYIHIPHHQIFENTKSTKIVRRLTDDALTEMIQNGFYGEIDSRSNFFFLLLINDEKEQKEIRRHLPVVISSATIEGDLQSENMVKPTGIITLDVVQEDNTHLYTDYTGLLILKENLKADKHILILATNPRGQGLKIWMRIPESLADFTKHFDAIEKYFLDTYNIVIAKSSRHILQKHIIPHDPDVYANVWSEIFEGKLEPKVEIQPLKETNVGKEEPDEYHKGYLLNNTPTISDRIYNALPKLLSDITKHFDSPRSKDVVLISTLTVLSVLIPNVYTMLRGRKIFSPLYAFISAPAASGKGVMQFSYDLLERVQEYHYQNYRKELKEYGEYNKKEAENSLPLEKQKPRQKYVHIPGNISHAKLNEVLDLGVYPLIYQPEADTLVNLIKNEWGDISDIIRAAYQHEPISIARKNLDTIIHINPSFLGILISGTLEQIKRFIPQLEDGLYSRFVFYAYEDKIKYSSPFSDAYPLLNQELDGLKQSVFQMYKELYERQSQIDFRFTEDQKKTLDDFFEIGLAHIQKTGATEAIASFNRGQIVFARIAMLLSTLRLVAPYPDVIVCDDVSFETSFELLNILQKHSMSVMLTYEAKINSIKANERVASAMIFAKLDNTFTSSQVIALVQEMGKGERSAYRYIAKWQKEGLVIPEFKKGDYKKA